jgi:hypothetical protein
VVLTRENWIYEFDAQAYASYHGRFPRRPLRTHDRVLLKYLQEDEVPVKEIIDNVSQLKLDPQDMAMVVVFKEKELKSDKARDFCKLTYMRLWQVATEKNLGDPGIFSYIRYQSMTMSEQEQTHYLLSLVKSFSKTHGGKVAISIDFEAWCQGWDSAVTHPVFKEIERIFGIKNIYTFSHLFPQLCLVVIQNRWCPPKQKPEPSIYSPYTLSRWFEGMRQKGWTLTTILLILLAADKIGTVAELIRQGDNMAPTIMVPGQEILTSMGLTTGKCVDHYVDTLVDVASNIGQTAKKEETWASTYLQRISDIEIEMVKKCDEPRVREIVKEELELNSCNEPMFKKIVEEVITGEGQNLV